MAARADTRGTTASACPRPFDHCIELKNAGRSQVDLRNAHSFTWQLHPGSLNPTPTSVKKCRVRIIQLVLTKDLCVLIRDTGHPCGCAQCLPAGSGTDDAKRCCSRLASNNQCVTVRAIINTFFTMATCIRPYKSDHPCCMKVQNLIYTPAYTHAARGTHRTIQLDHGALNVLHVDGVYSATT